MLFWPIRIRYANVGTGPSDGGQCLELASTDPLKVMLPGKVTRIDRRYFIKSTYKFAGVNFEFIVVFYVKSF